MKNKNINEISANRKIKQLIKKKKDELIWEKKKRKYGNQFDWRKSKMTKMN